jgi:hypothetical protein
MFSQVNAGDIPPAKCGACHKTQYNYWENSSHNNKNCSMCHGLIHSGSIRGCRECHERKHRIDINRWEIIKSYNEIIETDYVCTICHNSHSGKIRLGICNICHHNNITLKIKNSLHDLIIKKELKRIHDVYGFYDNFIYKFGRWAFRDRPIFLKFTILTISFILILAVIFPYIFTTMYFLKRFKDKSKKTKRIL